MSKSKTSHFPAFKGLHVTYAASEMKNIVKNKAKLFYVSQSYKTTINIIAFTNKQSRLSAKSWRVSSSLVLNLKVFINHHI